MKQQTFRTLDEFWPYYVREHRKPVTRQLHFIGNTNLFMWLFWAYQRRSMWLVIVGVLSSYMFAWVGHFAVERNVPATFRYPVLAALADMKMYALMLRGEMNAEVEKYASLPQGK